MEFKLVLLGIAVLLAKRIVFGVLDLAEGVLVRLRRIVKEYRKLVFEIRRTRQELGTGKIEQVTARDWVGPDPLTWAFFALFSAACCCLSFIGIL